MSALAQMTIFGRFGFREALTGEFDDLLEITFSLARSPETVKGHDKDQTLDEQEEGVKSQHNPPRNMPKI